ncbi:hypothetical protein J1N35_046010 [Gossypium stocksii]|uniref:Aminotransferase-like plant mobile domain-containing protein n=1 Tax=Gossypium stocksii TaxID=47602 RepID=A0A9D3UC43_9ROSI|nr:hypothetical protein J1N35_046010 [Gossypium stocksii]
MGERKKKGEEKRRGVFEGASSSKGVQKGSYRLLRGSVNSVGYLSNPRLILYLEASGFESVAMIHTFDLKYDLVSTLVEQWRSETYKFHLSCGECTITLEDVAQQPGPSIDGSAVMGLGLKSTSYNVSRASSDDKEPCHGHRRVLGIVVVLGTIQDAILGISYSPNIFFLVVNN